MSNNSKPQINTEPQIIRVCSEIEDPIGSLDEVVQYILQIKEEYSKYSNVQLDYVAVTYEDYVYQISYDRLENEAELETRIAKEKFAVREWEQKQLDLIEKQKILAQKHELQEQLIQLNQKLQELD